MDIEWPSSTSKGTALLRLMHQRDPDRILKDDYVSWFVNESNMANLRSVMLDISDNVHDAAEAFNRIAYRYAILRERLIDDIIESSIESGCRQLLLLGSGYDTRFFRLPSIQNHSVATFEVDLPELIIEKARVLRKHLGSLPKGLFLIPLNFNEKNWTAILDGGFCAAIPTVTVWQGVSYYLPKETVSAVLQFIRNAMADESLLTFDCCWPHMLVENDEIPGVLYNIERLKDIGEPYIFGMDPQEMTLWLQEKGFRNIGIFLLDDLEMSYVHTRTLPRKAWYVVTAK